MDMNFHCERSVPEMDIFLNFAAFLMIWGPDETFLIPDLAKLKQPSTYITNLLKENNRED
jgi:hypothetical protein